MDHIKKTVKIWHEYYRSDDPELDSSNPRRATSVRQY